VTGAASGLGAAVARALTAAGRLVAGLDLRPSPESALGVEVDVTDVHYAASKGAIVGFTRALATEVEGTGVAVNTVAPGAAGTPVLGTDSPWRSGDFLATLPVRRLVRPEEIAAAALFLLEVGTAVSRQVLAPNAGATI
jgi:NAD(P)-dependent dehydrogenase (short-subunit alcohol dehydrogenase family)